MSKLFRSFIAILIVIVILYGVALWSLPPPEERAKWTPWHWWQHRQAEGYFMKGQKCQYEWEISGNKDDFNCAVKNYKDAINIDQHGNYYFALGHLLVLNNERDLALDYIVKAIELDPGNKIYQEYLLVLTPHPLKPVEDIYTDDINARFFTTGEMPNTVFISEETDFPHSGTKAIQLTWQKSRGNWASLVIGFDPKIRERDRARKGLMQSWDLSNKDDYVLEFYLRGAHGGEQIAVKFQDQNLIIKESIGNQVVYYSDDQKDFITASPNWEKVSLPLKDFGSDSWIFRDYGRFEFDWRGVKQINFDPYYYESTSGTVYLDDIKLVRIAK